MRIPVIGIPTANSNTGRSPRLALERAYCDAIAQAGGAPLLIPLLDDEPMLNRLYALLDGLLLAGGGDVAAEHYGAADGGKLIHVDHQRDRVELFLARRALAERMPVFGICRGIQSLNVAAGGTLIQDIPSEVSGALVHRTPAEYPLNYLAHDVVVEPRTLLAEILVSNCDTLEASAHVPVNSHHHQAVRKVAPEFRVSAHAPDGVIEAIEYNAPNGAFALGVQWHPEHLVPEIPAMVRLFRGFVQACQ